MKSVRLNFLILHELTEDKIASSNEKCIIKCPHLTLRISNTETFEL